MRPSWRASILAGCTLIGLYAGPGIGATAVSSDRLQAVITEAPFGRFGRTVKAAFHVAATPTQVFGVLTDYEHMAEFMPMVDEVKLLVARPDGARVSFRVRYMNLFDLVEVDERTYEGARRITWTAVQGPLKVSDGSWTLTPKGAGTHVVYRTDVDPGFPLPAQLTSMIIRNGLPEFLEGIARRSESGGRWRKP